jgi:pimeloyl-ACP methyl ester carboxylesterase
VGIGLLPLSYFLRGIRHYRRVRLAMKNTVDLVRTTMQGHRVTRLTDFSCCRRPVLLIYGFGATRRVFNVMEKRLRRDGFDVFSINMGSLSEFLTNGTITYRAEFVARKIERLYRRFSMGPLTIIGHSEGGLIGRYYVQFLGGESRVRTLITLATPHQGTPAAIVGAATIGLFARNMWQLLPQSPFVRSLAKRPFPASVRLFSIYSDSDWVCPPRQCRAIDAFGREIGTNIEMPGLGHNDFLFTKAPYKVIRKILFDVPVDNSCGEAQREAG